MPSDIPTERGREQRRLEEKGRVRDRGERKREGEKEGGEGGRDREGISLKRTRRVERPAFLASSTKCLFRAEVIAKLLLATSLLRVHISFRAVDLAGPASHLFADGL